MKLGPSASSCSTRARAAGLVALALLGVVGCGYSPVYAAPAPEQRLSVKAVGTRVARADLVQAALDGARAELAMEGAFADGERCPRLELEVLRLDELSSGIVLGARAGDEAPLARGTRIGVVARGWVVERDGGPRLRDTGDLRRFATGAAGLSPAEDGAAHDRSARDAARAVGAAVARSVLGDAEPGVEMP